MEATGDITIWYSNNEAEIAWGEQMVEAWNADHPDEQIKAQEIPAGAYTLRFAVQPDIGDHTGTAPHPDFCLMCPAAKDRSADPIEKKDLIALSSEVNEGRHPAVLLLFPSAARDDAPKVVGKGDGVWVATDDGTLTRFDTRTGLVDGTPVRLPFSAATLAAGHGALWLTGQVEGERRVTAKGNYPVIKLARVDPAARRVAAVRALNMHRCGLKTFDAKARQHARLRLRHHLHGVGLDLHVGRQVHGLDADRVALIRVEIGHQQVAARIGAADLAVLTEHLHVRLAIGRDEREAVVDLP